MRKAVLLLGLLLTRAPLSAEDLTLSAEVDARAVGLDDQLQLTISVSGRSLALPDNLGVPPLKNLRVVGGPSVSTQVSFVNGAVSQGKTFTYVLQPTAVGQAEVGALRVKLSNGEERTTTAIAVDVSEGSVRPRPRRSADPFGWDPFGQDPLGEDPFEALLGRSRRGGRRGAAPKVYVEVTVSRPKVFVGEPVLLQYQLYTQTPVTDLQFAEPPKYAGFWAEDIQRPSGGIRGTPVKVEGETFQRFAVVEKLLFPTKAGRLSIPAAKLRISLARESVFDGLPAAVERSTKPLTVDVAAIPEGRSFSGAVGQFQAQATLDRPFVALGEAATLRVRLSGRGNLKWIERAPEIQVPGAKVYPPQAKDDITLDATGMSGSRTWEHVVVPETSGRVTIPALSFEYFDPASAQMRRAATAPLSLEVVGGAAGAATSAGPSVPARVTTAQGGLALRAELEPEPVVLPALAPRVVVALAAACLLAHLILWRAPGIRSIRGGTRGRTPRAGARAALAAIAAVQRGGGGKEAAALALEDALTGVFGPLDGPLEGEAERAARAVLDEVRFIRYAPQLGDYSEKVREVAVRAAEVVRRHA